MLSFKSFLLVLGFLLLTPQLGLAQSLTNTDSNTFTTTSASNVPTASGVAAQGNYTANQQQILGMFFAGLVAMGNPEVITEFTGSTSEFSQYAPFANMIRGFRSGDQNQVFEGIKALSFPFSDNDSNE